MPASPDWYPIPPHLLRDLRADGFVVRQDASGVYTVCATQAHPFSLLMLIVQPGGQWLAKVMKSSSFGKTVAFRAASQRAVDQIAKGLRATSRTGHTKHIRTPMGHARRDLVKAATTFAPPKQETRVSQPRKFLQGGAPGLGKRG